MRHTSLLLLFAVPLHAAADEKKGDLKAMQGTWQVVGAESAGKKAPADEIKKANLRLHIDGNKFTYKDGETKRLSGTFTLDEKKTPPAIDVTGKSADGMEQKTVGIYEIKGDTMRVCFVMAGNPRPKEFKTEAVEKPEMEGPEMITYQRVKDK